MDFLTLVLFTVISLAPNGYCVKAEEIERDERTRDSIFNSIRDFSLASHVIEVVEVADSTECIFECLQNLECQSVNVQTKETPKRLCELNNATLVSKPACKQSRAGFEHLEPHAEPVDDPCSSSPCKNGAVCVYPSPCEKQALYECNNCSSFNSGFNCDDWKVPISSCREIYEKTNHRQNMAYTFFVNTFQTEIYCHMTELTGCGTGGWTLAIKMNGTKTTFRYDSLLWSNKISYNTAAGQTGFDDQETKLPSYWAVPLNTVCIGFKVGSDVKFASISRTAASLYDILSDGVQKTFSIGKSKWISLIAGSSLQPHCNREAFNVITISTHRKNRIGIVSNNENDCTSTDSSIGVGGDKITSGNICGSSYCSNGPKTIHALAYILVK